MAKTAGIGGRLQTRKAPQPFPEKLGDCIDLYFDARKARKAKEEEAEVLKKHEDRVKDHIIESFKKAEIDGARGKRGSINLREKDVPQVDEEAGGWEALQKHILKTGEWDLLQRRLGEAAAQARWEAGKAIPGVKKFHKIDITPTEAK